MWENLVSEGFKILSVENFPAGIADSVWQEHPYKNHFP